MPVRKLQRFHHVALIAAMMAAVVSPTMDAAVVRCIGDDGHVAVELAHGEGVCQAGQMHHDDHADHDTDRVCLTPHHCEDEPLSICLAVEIIKLRIARPAAELSPAWRFTMPQMPHVRAVTAWTLAPPSLALTSTTILVV